jgi:hypothetical protein
MAKALRRNLGKCLCRRLARVALRTSIGSRRMSVPSQQVESIQEGTGLVLLATQDMEDERPAFVAAHHLAVDQTERTMRWFPASTIRGKRFAQS